jgi:uncharacterized protein
MISEPDADHEPFWRGLAERRVVVQACRACGRRWVPRLPSCPYCRGQEVGDVTTSGTGCVYSWIRVHRAMSEQFAGEVPYVIATVDLDGGGRIFGRLDPADRATIGLLVEPRFVVHEGWTELRFAPRDGAPSVPAPSCAGTREESAQVRSASGDSP